MSSGFPRVRETSSRIGITFDDWQTDLNRCILSKTADGLYAADTVAMSVPRQVGKTFDVGAISFADCITDPGTTVVWTAHRFKVSRETFTELRSLAKSPKLKPHLEYDDITTAAGNECIPFRNGSRIVFAARERGAIRGFTKVRRLVLDEAQILTEAALADLAPTMNQAENPQIILMGTPPKPTDPGEVFTNIRAEALAGQSEGILYVEFAAPPGSDPDDRAAWALANPSFPTRTSARAILRMRKLLSADDFAREALGIWDEDRAPNAISAQLWSSLAETKKNVHPVGSVAFAVEMTPDRSHTSIAVAGKRKDDDYQVEIIDSGQESAWIVPRLVELNANHVVSGVIIDPAGAAAALIPAIEAAGIEVTQPTMRDVVQACGAFFDTVTSRKLRHINDPELNEGIKGAKQRALGGAWAWNRYATSADALMAATLALSGHQTNASADYDVRDSFF